MPQAVRVLVDEPAIDREFTYLLPAELASGRVPVRVGMVVRVMLNRRRLRGWVTELDAPTLGSRELAAISSVVGVGPPPHVVELARWAAWRWAGTWVHFLRTASADRVVAGVPDTGLARQDLARTDLARTDLARPANPAHSASPANPANPVSGPREGPHADDGTGPDTAWVAAAFARGATKPAAVRLGPCADAWPLVAEALRRGRLLVLTPTAAWAARLAGRLRRAGVATALMPREWAAAVSAQAVVGARAAVWAPCSRLDTVLVLDEHDEAYQSEAAPTWNARDVAAERARRDGASCLLVGAMPSPDALRLAGAGGTEGLGRVVAAPRACERESWPRVAIADRRLDDPATGEWCGEALGEVLRSGRTVVCVLNRTGRARLAYCASCGELACAPSTGRPLRLEAQQFVDPDSGEVRPAVCEACGAMKFRRARVGVKGVADEMERLARRPVVQVVGDAPLPVVGGPRQSASKAPLYIGTEAVLHRVPSADVVAFVDFDQELTAPRYRAGEEAYALLVRAARLLGPRSHGGHILVQTRLADHPVLRAAVEADPTAWARAETARREAMALPPASTWALISGAAAGAYVERVSEHDASGEIDVAEAASGSAGSTWRLRSRRREALLDALARMPRPSGRLRVAVDPMRA
ncbi:hypothetical protein [Candidatus Poriferisodalis sp.]|uniref:primosomal protein N' family DNA-binding protein n=1 Tax=Candidatus Poriferisodalis sp. TaxID=3101277 RepID=UPI003B017B10